MNWQVYTVRHDMAHYHVCDSVYQIWYSYKESVAFFMYCHVTCMSTKVCACWLYIGIETGGTSPPSFQSMPCSLCMIVHVLYSACASPNQKVFPTPLLYHEVFVLLDTIPLRTENLTSHHVAITHASCLPVHGCLYGNKFAHISYQWYFLGIN